MGENRRMPLSNLSTLINSTSQNLSQFKAFSAIDHLLLGGVPNIGGFTSKITTNNNENFGAKTENNPGPVFNTENIFINIANSLFQGNPSAQTAFNALASGNTLTDKLTSIYNALVDFSEQSDTGRAAFASQADFYQNRAVELGIPGDTGGAVVAFGALLNILVRDNNIGIGKSVNNLLQTVNDGTASLPETSTNFIPIETADGTTTIFSGSDLSNINNGTLSLKENIYTYSSDPADKQSITVQNGADLVADGVIKLRGASSELIVSGEGSSLTIKTIVDDDNRSTFGQYAGDSSKVVVSNGGSIQIDQNFRLGGIRVDTENSRGTIGASSTAELVISGASTVNINGRADFARDFPDTNDGGNGSERVTATVKVDGEGSSLTVGDSAGFGGSSGHGILNITNGADVKLNGDVNFSENQNLSSTAKSEIKIDGAGSTLTTGKFFQAGVFAGAETSIILDNGGSFTANEFNFARAGGKGDLTIKNGATLNVSSFTDIGQYAGSTATVMVDNGTILLSESLNLGDFRSGDNFSSGGSITAVKGGVTNVTIDIKNGGKVVTDKQISAATRYEIENGFEPAGETSNVTINITGNGSLLESKSQFSNFGVSDGGVATVNVLDGASLKLDQGSFGATPGNVSGIDGGKGHLIVNGAGSTASVLSDDKSLNFGDGNSASGTLTITNGGVVNAGYIALGSNGGQADATIDSGSLVISKLDSNGNVGGIDIGRSQSDLGNSSLKVINGGTMTIDGQNANSPYITIGRDSGSSGSLEISGTGSSISLINDLPRGTNGSTDFGNSILTIGRSGSGTVSVSDGAEYKNTSSGVVLVGQNAGSNGTLNIDGNGTKFDFGGALYIGAFEGMSTANVSVTNSAQLINSGSQVQSSGNVFKGIQLTSDGATLSIDSSSVVTSDLLVNGGAFTVGPAIETVSITGDVTQKGGSINFEVETGNSDKLQISGMADLDSKLSVEFKNGYTGVVGDEFVLMSASSFNIGSNFDLSVQNLASGLDAQVQVKNDVASLVIFNTEVADFTIL